MIQKFEWSKAKAKGNYAKHGVSFEFARGVFKDPFAVEFLDNREDYGEKRFVIIGRADGYLLYVAYTEREEAVRLISARRATKFEKKIYFENNS
jgi:uncharacterized DUF497 family protein